MRTLCLFFFEVDGACSLRNKLYLWYFGVPDTQYKEVPPMKIFVSIFMFLMTVLLIGLWIAGGGQTPAADKSVPAITPAPAAPTATVEAKVPSPALPKFVTHATICGGADLRLTDFASEEEGLDSVFKMANFDTRSHAVVYYVAYEGDKDMSHYVWQAGGTVPHPSGRTYLIVRFSADKCQGSDLTGWAQTNSENAAEWARSYTDWLNSQPGK